MRLIILGSGSSGNSVYVESGETSVLVDVGLSAKETARRMVEVGLDPSRLDAIIVTHEHSDHVKGVPVMSRTAGVRVIHVGRNPRRMQVPRQRARICTGARRSHPASHSR